MIYKSFFKVILDYTLSIIMILLFMPILLSICISLFITYLGTPFYIQERPGKNGKIFKLIKFKSMNDRRDEFGELLPSEKRLTPIGRFLRRFSLDELPQLFNVIKGDMSIVGPRPLRVEYLSHYDDFQKRRHEVKPGITGWGQVNGRNSISWEEKFELDIWYVDNLSFFIDVKILFLTLIRVLSQEGISPRNSMMAEPFKGIKLDG